MSYRERIATQIGALRAKGDDPKVLAITKRIEELLYKENLIAIAPVKFPKGCLTYFQGLAVIVGDDVKQVGAMVFDLLEMRPGTEVVLVHDEKEYWETE